MKKSLFEFLLEKQKLKTITALEKRVMNLYLQKDVLMRYFKIAFNYCKTVKIQKEVEEVYTSWTGYENYYWYTYHYEGFGNALYSYKEAITNILKSISNQDRMSTKDFLKSDFVLKSMINGKSLRVFLDDFIKDSSIDKILKDRGDSIHDFGQWRSELSDELGIQDWKSAEIKIVVPITTAYDRLKIFDEKIMSFINDQII